METELNRRPRGRPFSFDREKVLDQAVGVFWAKGYDAASLDDLVEAMGVTRPSIYAAFGNKHALFLSAMDRYGETNGGRKIKPLLEESDPRQAVLGFLTEVVHDTTRRSCPKGCLISNVAIELAERDGDVREKLTGMFGMSEQLIAMRLNELPPAALRTVPSVELARMISLFSQGLASHARLGIQRRELKRSVVQFVQAMLPT